MELIRRRAREMETMRLEQRRKEQHKAEIQRLRDERLPQEVTIPDLQEDMPDWFRELPEGVFGPFTKEQAWEAANDILTVVEDLGLVPGPGFGKGEGPPEAPEVDEPPAPETTEASDVAGDKGELRPAQQGETPTETPTPTQGPDEGDEGLEILDKWREENLELFGDNIEVRGRISDAYLRARDLYLRGAMDLEEVRALYGEIRGQAAQPTATATATATATPGPTPKYYTIYIVQPNENLTRIATQHKVSVQDILNENKDEIKDANQIYEGQEIKIPVLPGTPIPPNATQYPTQTPLPFDPPKMYIPQPNESLGSMRTWYQENYGKNIPVQAIIDANQNLFSDHPNYDPNDPYKVYAGVRYTIPVEGSPPPEPVIWASDIPEISIPEYDLSITNPNDFPPIFTEDDPFVQYLIDNDIEFVSKEEWGGIAFNIKSPKEGLKADEEDRFEIYDEELGDELTTGVIHHSGHGEEDNIPQNDYFNISLEEWEGMDEEARKEVIQKLQQIHMEQNGWADVGYHFIIAPDGTIYEGRDLRVKGANTEEFNNGVIGILVMGDFTEQDPSTEQVESLGVLTTSLGKTFGINCLARHKDFNSTACPGEHWEDGYQQLRQNLGIQGSYQCYQDP